jgi:peptidyl-prolyl cis-trans isomerase A (cyclophilin A)
MVPEVMTGCSHARAARHALLASALCAALAACAAGEPQSERPAQDPAKLVFTLEQATAGLEGTGPLMARLTTSQGTFAVRLFGDEAPLTVANFVGLARGLRPFRDARTGQWRTAPFYDGLTFHRVIPDFMIQGGDPLGDGRGGPGYRFADELGAGKKHDRPGVLSMANAGPDTNGSQFFVTDQPAPHLDGRHTIFGEVVEGLEVVKKIARVERDARDRPLQPVVIEKVTITRGDGPG